MLSMMKITRVQTQRKQINVKVKKVRHAMKTQMTMPNPMRRLALLQAVNTRMMKVKMKMEMTVQAGR